MVETKLIKQEIKEPIIIVAKKKYNCDHLQGTFVDETNYDILVEEDTDCYMPESFDFSDDKNINAEKRIAFKFRKNYFTKEEQDKAYRGLRGAATESQNRGMAAGPRGEILTVSGRGGRDWVRPYEIEMLEFLTSSGARLYDDTSIESIRAKYAGKPLKDVDETRGNIWLRSEVTKVYPEYHGWFDKWVDEVAKKPDAERKAEALNVLNNWVSTTNYAKSVKSGVAGWYDRYPRIPYGRPTAYTEKFFPLFEESFPFLQHLDKGYKELLPWRWGNQKAAAEKIDSRFLVPETVFTTITVNKSFRTAAHFDAGDLNDGLSNLLVLGDGEYTGGYLVFPEYRVAVNVRPGDLLLVNNHEILHGNTPIELNFPEAERISLVCYFREKMLELKDYDYENLRKQFVEERKTDKNHPLQRKLWNGISEGMWFEKEWYDYLKKHNMKDPYGESEASSLESFFG